MSSTDDWRITAVDRNMREREFENMVAQALPLIIRGANITRDARIGAKYRADFLVEFPDGKTAIVEAKGVTPGTTRRLRESAYQLETYAEELRKSKCSNSPIELAIAIPGALSPENKKYLLMRGVHVIDGDDIRSAGIKFPFDPFDGTTPTEMSETTEYAQVLLDKLEVIKPGKGYWSEYQSACKYILEFLLCPPLEQPIEESSNEAGVNRRDIIFPNYSTSGFWHYMRSLYEAHYIVADAKNYSEEVGKPQILQLANYLSPHGAGLFGLIITRKSGDRSAEVTIREQWYMHRKLIVILNDGDLKQMLAMKVAAEDPAIHIRQRIEDFRLKF